MIDRYRNYRPYISTPEPRTSNHRGILFLIVTLLFLFVVPTLLRKLHHEDPKNTALASAKSQPKPVITAEPISQTTWEELNRQLTAAIQAHPELDIAVSVIDINANTKGNYGVQDNFSGASTTKVLTATAFLHQVETGKESLNSSINGMSAKTQLKQMIKQSNNESWDALNSELSYAVIESYAKSIGISSYNHVNNVITAGDEALLLEKLYNGTLLNKQNQALLLSYMQQTNNEDMIPKIAPDGAQVFHKYGQLDARLHDAAIIEYRNHPIVLVIYTKGQADANGSEYNTRVQVIQSLAQIVFGIVYKD